LARAGTKVLGWAEIHVCEGATVYTSINIFIFTGVKGEEDWLHSNKGSKLKVKFAFIPAERSQKFDYKKTKVLY